MGWNRTREDHWVLSIWGNQTCASHVCMIHSHSHGHTTSIIYLSICWWSCHLNHPHERWRCCEVWNPWSGETQVVDAVVRPVRLRKGLILLSKLQVKCAVLRWDVSPLPLFCSEILQFQLISVEMAVKLAVGDVFNIIMILLYNFFPLNLQKSVFYQ